MFGANRFPRPLNRVLDSLDLRMIYDTGHKSSTDPDYPKHNSMAMKSDPHQMYGAGAHI